MPVPINTNNNHYDNNVCVKLVRTTQRAAYSLSYYWLETRINTLKLMWLHVWYEVYKDHHVMTCIRNRVNLHLFLTILTMLRKSWFYQYKIIVLSLSCHSPERWSHGSSCVIVLRSSTPEIYWLLVHLYSGEARSTVCAIPPAMFN